MGRTGVLLCGALPAADNEGVLQKPSRPPVGLLLASGLIGLIFALAFVVPVPLWQGQPALPPAPAGPDLPPPSDPLPGFLVAFVFALALCLPFRPYWQALRLLAQNSVSQRWLVGLTVFLALVAVLIYPRFGTDLFEYAAYGRQWVVYGSNPLLATPDTHPADWTTAFAWYRDRPSAYGPLWALLSAPAALLAVDATRAVIAYKTLAVLGYVICCVLLWRGSPRAHRARSLVLFAWNPLVLFEVLGKAHNDVWPAALALGAVLLTARGAARPGVAAAALAGLVKLSGGVTAIPLLHAVWSSGRRLPALISLLIAAALVALLYAPFWVGPATLGPVLQQTSRLVWSPGSILLEITHRFVVAVPDTVMRLLLAAVWLTALYLIARIGPRLAPPRVLASRTALVLLATLGLLTTAFFAHYLVPVIALTALARAPRLEKLVLGVSLGSLAAYAVDLLSLSFGGAWIGSPSYVLAGSLAILLGPALVGAFSILPGILRWPYKRRRDEGLVTGRCLASSSLPPLG